MIQHVVDASETEAEAEAETAWVQDALSLAARSSWTALEKAKRAERQLQDVVRRTPACGIVIGKVQLVRGR